MSKSLTMAELRKMNEADLLRDITQQYRVIGRLRQVVKSGKEKNSSLLKREKLQLSRMLTALKELRTKPAEAKIPASAPSGATAGKPASSSVA